MKRLLFPLALAAIGILASIIAVFMVGQGDTQNPAKSLNLGTYISGAGPTICAIIAAEDSENYLFHCKKHFAEKGINGWNIEIHSVDSNGAQISVD